MIQTQIGQDILFSLKQAIVHEEVKGAFELGTLEILFYETTQSKIKHLSVEEMASAIVILRKLLNKRVSKIIRIASLVPLAQITDIKLTKEEKELYNTIYNSCNGFKIKIINGDNNE